MEAVGLTTGITGLVSALGIIPTLVIVSIVAFFFFREIKKSLGSLEASVKNRTETLEKKLQALKEESDQKDEKILALIENHDKELRAVQTTFLTREQHYRDFENWKSEIQELRTEVRSLPVTIINMMKGSSK